MRQAVELIVFDWDGTLMDSAARIASSLAVAASRVGLPRLPDARLRDVIGLGLDEAMAELYPQATLAQKQALVRTYRQYFMHECEEEERLFEGVEQVLDRLSRSVPWLAVASGRTRVGLVLRCVQLGLGAIFTSPGAQTRPPPNRIPRCCKTSCAALL